MRVLDFRLHIDAGSTEESMSRRLLVAMLAVAGCVGHASGASAQTAPIVIKAATVIDGKGGTLSNVAIVIQDAKIRRRSCPA